MLREAADMISEWSKRLPASSEWRGALAGIQRTMLNALGEHEDHQHEAHQHEEDEMGRRTLTGQLFRAARLSASGRAVRTGQFPRRVKNVAEGRAIGKLGG